MLSELTAESYKINARFVFTTGQTFLERASIVVEQGQIVDVHSQFLDGAIDLGNVAVLPGLINAHTHLEFSQLPKPLGPNAPFTHWIDSVINYRGTAEVDRPSAIQKGMQECIASGVTTIGEIDTLTGDECFPVTESSTRGIRFREIIGLNPEGHAALLDSAQQFLQQSTGLWKPGLSPHAPYSVHFELLEKIVQLAARNCAPVALHWAETAAERELIESHTGHFVEFLKQRGIWNSDWFDKEIRLLDYLKSLSESKIGLVIHANHINSAEIDFLADTPNLSVVYCPRTHAYFQHPPHPWQELLSRGVNVALGTDSRASNPDLSLFNELRFLHQQFPDVPPGQLIDMATICGARALGLESQIGRISAGNRADFVIVGLPESSVSDPHALVFDNQSRILATVVDGRPI